MLRCVEQSSCGAARYFTKSLKTYFVFCSVQLGRSCRVHIRGDA
jgi:hypothetical protein